MSLFTEMTHVVRDSGGPRISGYVSAIIGMKLTVRGIERAVGIGSRIRVQAVSGQAVEGEVVGIDGSGTHVLPFGTWSGIGPGATVEIVPGGDTLRPGRNWIGRVVDPLGLPLDGLGPLPPGGPARQIRSAPPPAFGRRGVGRRLETGVKALDVFAPLCAGQRLGIFAGSGVGKSTLMSMLARRGEADAVVVCLVGERGREVQDFLHAALGTEGLARSVVVAATGDTAPLLRRQAAWTATTIAEALRDEGMNVLMMLDSITRFAQAQREIGLSLGEPPAARGYPPTVFAELPQLLERTGPGLQNQGDITALYTVLVDGDDLNDPVADAVRGILDGHVVLSRRIAERGRYPAIDLERSLSRMLPDCHSPQENGILSATRAALARYSEMEDLIRIGAYKHGTDEITDRAIAIATRAEDLLAQTRESHVPPREAFDGLYAILSQEGADVPGH